VASPAPEAPGSVSGSATGRFLPGFAATIAESPAATTILRGAGALGALGAAADAGITGYNAYQLYNQGDTVGAGREVTGFGGRLGGALSGAWALGELGAVGGPWGALGGALVGGVTGAVLGDKAVKGIYDYLTGYQPPQSSNTSQPTPGFPDQFAAQFDTANGGGPYSDPATGMQLETQAQYDARKHAYVDQQMTNQQAQAQQFLDTLNPLGSNNTNTGERDRQWCRKSRVRIARRHRTWRSRCFEQRKPNKFGSNKHRAGPRHRTAGQHSNCEPEHPSFR
jgi:hypothetical protein